MDAEINSIILFIEIVIIIFLLLISGLISASEVAFFSFRLTDKENIEKLNDSISHFILKCLNHPEKILATILVLNNGVNISIIILSTYVTNQILNIHTHPFLEFTMQVIVITFIILLIGEILPKVFAVKNNIRIARIMAIPLWISSYLLRPIIYPMITTSKVVNKRLAKIKQNISVNDLSSALEITGPALVDEKSILEGIVKFGNIQVSQIMRPRLDIVAIPYDANYSKTLSIVVDSGYSRIPVYENTLDNIKGIILAKDLLPYMNEKENFNWHALIKSAYFVPETKKIDDLLSEFQKNKIHLAIVVDEHGGTSGLVTMEDILEEIIGEIEDESDVEEKMYKKIGSHTWLFEAKITINDFCKVTQTDEDYFDEIKGNYETLAGFILELKEEIPVKGEKIIYKAITFEIESVDKRRIKQIKVTFNN